MTNGRRRQPPSYVQPSYGSGAAHHGRHAAQRRRAPGRCVQLGEALVREAVRDDLPVAERQAGGPLDRRCAVAALRRRTVENRPPSRRDHGSPGRRRRSRGERTTTGCGSTGVEATARPYGRRWSSTGHGPPLDGCQASATRVTPSSITACRPAYVLDRRPAARACPTTRQRLDAECRAHRRRVDLTRPQHRSRGQWTCENDSDCSGTGRPAHLRLAHRWGGPDPRPARAALGRRDREPHLRRGRARRWSVSPAGWPPSVSAGRPRRHLRPQRPRLPHRHVRHLAARCHLRAGQPAVRRLARLLRQRRRARGSSSTPATTSTRSSEHRPNLPLDRALRVLRRCAGRRRRLGRAAGRRAGSARRPVTETDVAHLSYTSGTSGLPKGACLAHEPTMRATRCIAERLRMRLERREPRADGAVELVPAGRQPAARPPRRRHDAA